MMAGMSKIVHDPNMIYRLMMMQKYRNRSNGNMIEEAKKKTSLYEHAINE